MPRLILTAAILMICSAVRAQYINDNVAYKLVYASDLCRELKKNPGYVLLDVRSSGEYNDTSANASSNIGHLEGAINIDIRQLPQRLHEINALRNQPVFVYCATSQRSRRASKLLADSGFTNIRNINAGITGLYLVKEEDRACLQNLLITGNPYTVLSPQNICKKLLKPSGVFILDVRPDSMWQGISSNARYNAYGYLRGTRHVSVRDLPGRVNDIPRDKEIIITDLNGSDASAAAKLLKEKGFPKVYVMMEGMDRWLNSDYSTWSCAQNLYVPAVDYNIISSEEFARRRKKNNDLVLLDIRSREEFENRHELAYRNIGHLDSAIHISFPELKNRLAELEKFKSRPLIVYTFSAAPEAYNAAALLKQNGFKNVSVLASGLFNIRWAAANIPGMSFMNNWVVDVPSQNK